jgi:hypothetical protein
MYKLKEEIKNEIVKNKQEEMTNFLDKLEKNPVSSKPFWSLINKTRAKNNSNNIPTLKKDGVEYTSDEDNYRPIIQVMKLKIIYSLKN